MRSLSIKIATALIGAVAFSGAASAQEPSFTSIDSRLDCSAGAGGCTVTRYGFSTPESYDIELNAWNPLAIGHDDFNGSYFYSKNNPVPGASECIAERIFSPLFGQVLLREESDCTPPALGAGVCQGCPGGTGSCTNGTVCNTGFDCPRGLCSNLDAGCPVEVATDLAVPGEGIAYGTATLSATGTAFGPIWVGVAFNGAMVTDGPTLFDPPKRAGIGRRFTNPGGGTRIFWVDMINGGGNTIGDNFSTLCCNDNLGGALCAGQLFNKYPSLTPLPERANEGRNEAPWIFPDDNPATGLVEGDWAMDESWQVPGQIYGNCSIDRRVGCSAPAGLSNAQCTRPGQPFACCTEAGVGYCGGECNVGGCTTRGCAIRVCSNSATTRCTANADCGAGTCLNPSCTSNADCPVVAGSTNSCLATPLAPCRLNSQCPGSGTCAGITNIGTCDLRERGWRFNRALSSLSDGSPDPSKCNASPFIFRGFRNRNCSVIELYNECLALPHNAACTSAAQPFPCCTGAGAGSCGPTQTCNVESGQTIGRCSIDTDVKCSVGPSPYPKTLNNNVRWGDPGPDCAILNFGPQVRPDVDCDGVEDPTLDLSPPAGPDTIGDLCTYYSEIDPFTDTDGDGKRGDACECGDSNGNGFITVADIVDINTKIFSPPAANTPAFQNADLSAPLSDANEDGLFNVSDIVAVNLDLFNAQKTSRCGRAPVIGE